MSLARFELELLANGGGRVVVGGVDLSAVTRQLSLHTGPGGPPRLMLEVLGDGHVDGMADVTVVQGGVAGLAEFFAHIDAGELEKEALSRMGGFDDTSATRHMLDVLAEWAAGA